MQTEAIGPPPSTKKVHIKGVADKLMIISDDRVKLMRTEGKKNIAGLNTASVFRPV